MDFIVGKKSTVQLEYEKREQLLSAKIQMTMNDIKILENYLFSLLRESELVRERIKELG